MSNTRLTLSDSLQLFFHGLFKVRYIYPASTLIHGVSVSIVHPSFWFNPATVSFELWFRLHCSKSVSSCFLVLTWLAPGLWFCLTLLDTMPGTYCSTVLCQHLPVLCSYEQVFALVTMFPTCSGVCEPRWRLPWWGLDGATLLGIKKWEELGLGWGGI